MNEQNPEASDPSNFSEDILHYGGGVNVRRGCFTPLNILAVISALLMVSAIVVPNFIRARAQNRGTPCKSNLKNIATAFEMYSTDWAGKYPSSLSQLTPNYLKTIPECPSAGTITYRAQTGLGVAYNSDGFEDYYFVYCHGRNHTSVSVPENYPQYDAIQGLIER